MAEIFRGHPCDRKGGAILCDEVVLCLIGGVGFSALPGCERAAGDGGQPRGSGDVWERYLFPGGDAGNDGGWDIEAAQCGAAGGRSGDGRSGDTGEACGCREGIDGTCGEELCDHAVDTG